ncbi:MAG: 2-C-methyl-D-erythritol 4-phosphate cytidylyltransferase [Muribaculaceae bacterium]|nr:2-C-methyl-D-erythritol 4-phosphate cytidylyltransferase [Roseburia sp.]MCM1432243.1 2-C-methyl-D-erythritol 4-phosphate cytidylyltransferase [Muribaculaceae bacterium]MCM1491980.1 2-C-methyl-D-erythritol 4-phosphate cytidylyltransferase [Muribaculaceae bacterium]
MEESYTAIVLSAGSGRRMHSDTPKQYLELCGHPVLYYSLKAFEESGVDSVVLVAGKDDLAYCREQLVEKYSFRKVRAVVAGGAERYLSVYNGLQACGKTDYVLIHDGARPLLTKEDIQSSMECVRREKACVLAVPVKDTIREAGPEGYAKRTPDRSTLWAMQTPQSFSRSLLMEAYRRLLERQQEGEQPVVTDDAMIVEYSMNQSIRILPGHYRNMKITTPEDLMLAEILMRQKN